jgi:hypothetical protein
MIGSSVSMRRSRPDRLAATLLARGGHRQDASGISGAMASSPANVAGSLCCTDALGGRPGCRRTALGMSALGARPGGSAPVIVCVVHETSPRRSIATCRTTPTWQCLRQRRAKGRLGLVRRCAGDERPGHASRFRSEAGRADCAGDLSFSQLSIGPLRRSEVLSTRW